MQASGTGLVRCKWHKVRDNNPPHMSETGPGLFRALSLSLYLSFIFIFLFLFNLFSLALSLSLPLSLPFSLSLWGGWCKELPTHRGDVLYAALETRRATGEGERGWMHLL